MGRIGIVLSFERRVLPNGVQISEVKCDPGGGYNTTPAHYSAPGDDSFPLESDLILLVPSVRTGSSGVSGYVDPKLVPVAEAGDKRIYARDSEGASICEVWLKNDGSIDIKNGTGLFTLEAAGDIVINGVRFAPGGIMTDVNGIEVDSKELRDHTHPSADPPANTGTNN